MPGASVRSCGHYARGAEWTDGWNGQRDRSEALRRNATFRTNLANGDFRAVASSPNTTNIGVNIPAGQTIAGATLRSSGLFPENFMTANPQFAAMEMRNAQFPAPGRLGSIGLRPICGPGPWDFDANLQKKIRIGESRSLTIRIDACNTFNHPAPAIPNLDINSGTFGEIATKTGSRTLAGQVRLEF